MSVLLVFLLVSTMSQLQWILGEKTGLHANLSCKPKRTEIEFPIISDVTGRVTPPDSTPSSDVLHVTLVWRRRRLRLLLFPNELTTPTTISEWNEGNVTYAETLDKPCFYQGYVKDQRSSYIALSACDGLAGYIQTQEEILFLQPKKKLGHQARRAHVLYSCEPSDHSPQPDRQGSFTDHQTSRRRRAAYPSKYLEVMLVVDHSLVKQIGSKERTRDYVMTLMNIANTVYQHKSLGVDIRVVVVKIIFLEQRQQRDVLTRNDPFHTVNKFCAWSQRQIPAGQPMDYDIAVLITKEELGPSGYAPITGLCNPTRSCAAVRDEGLTTGFIIAHESAHVFGLFHDGHGNNCHGRKYQTSMMAAMVESKLNHFWWSECSARRMKEMVRYLFCLNNVPKGVEDHYSLQAPEKLERKLGRPWSLDFQCRMEFGTYFKRCAAFYSDPCGVLWCSEVSRPHRCRTKRGPPMPGTSCGRERECRNERCEYVGNMRPVNGGWGSWSQWTDCSSQCGVGIKQRMRACDRPEPAFGGKECEGESSKWDTCLNNTCEAYEDIRASECSVWDSVQVKYGTHKWQPFEGQNASSLCKQTCRSFYTQEILTIDVESADGTPCSYTGNNSNICVLGKCVQVGCDGQFNSTAKVDRCGVCEGDGSQCKLVQGTIYKTATSPGVYTFVLELPPGARNITIVKGRQASQYLALEDARYDKFYLNGNKRQSGDMRLVINGAMFQYNVSRNDLNETIFSQGPLRGPVNVMIFPARAQGQKISVYYSYTVHKSDFTLEKNKYKWVFDKWSECSVTCGVGRQEIMHACQDKDTKESVEDELCQVLTPPRKDQVACHREQCGIVRYNYAMDSTFSNCSGTCGRRGIQIQNFHCERIFLRNNSREQVSLHSCKHLKPPNYSRECQGLSCKDGKRLISYRWSVSGGWTECPCGKGNVQSREVQCEEVATTGDQNETLDVVDDAQCTDEKPATEQACDGSSCKPKYRWVMSSNWTECPCGKGNIQSREVQCEKVTTYSDHNETVEVVGDAQCTDNKLATEQACDGPLCRPSFQWVEGGAYSPCDAQCGQEGAETALLVCELVTFTEQGEVTERADDFLCDDVPKPVASQRPCNQSRCPHFRWVEGGAYSPCDAQCGQEGVETALLVCELVTFSQQGEVTERADDFLCDDVPKPAASQRPCNQSRCPHFRWVEGGAYSPCDAQCGQEGTETALLVCELVTFSEQGEVTERADEFLCDDVPKPVASQRPCNQSRCPQYQWVADEQWSACNASCAQRGIQSRLYWCEKLSHDGIASNVSDDHCDIIVKTNETRQCQGPECSLEWTIGQWSECSVTCGQGKRYRKVHCGNPDTDLDDVRCKKAPPPTSKTCSNAACKEEYGGKCKDMYSFCASYKALRYRCKRHNFRRKCCKTCRNANGSSRRPRHALSRYRLGMGR